MPFVATPSFSLPVFPLFPTVLSHEEPRVPNWDFHTDLPCYERQLLKNGLALAFMLPQMRDSRFIFSPSDSAPKSWHRRWKTPMGLPFGCYGVNALVECRKESNILKGSSDYSEHNCFLSMLYYFSALIAESPRKPDSWHGSLGF